MSVDGWAIGESDSSSSSPIFSLCSDVLCVVLSYTVGQRTDILSLLYSCRFFHRFLTEELRGEPFKHYRSFYVKSMPPKTAHRFPYVCSLALSSRSFRDPLTGATVRSILERFCSLLKFQVFATINRHRPQDWIRVAELPSFASACPNVEVLHLTEEVLEESMYPQANAVCCVDALSIISRSFVNLRKLIVRSNRWIIEDSEEMEAERAEEFAGNGQVREIDLKVAIGRTEHTKLSERQLQRLLSLFPNIEAVKIENEMPISTLRKFVRVTGEPIDADIGGVEPLRVSPLQVLYFSRCDVSIRLFVRLTLSNITRASFSMSQLHFGGRLPPYEQMNENLRRLSLSIYCDFDSRDLKILLEAFPRLEHLGIGHSQIGNQILPLQQLPHHALRSIDACWADELTFEGMKVIVSALYCLETANFKRRRYQRDLVSPFEAECSASLTRIQLDDRPFESLGSLNQFISKFPTLASISCLVENIVGQCAVEEHPKITHITLHDRYDSPLTANAVVRILNWFPSLESAFLRLQDGDDPWESPFSPRFQINSREFERLAFAKFKPNENITWLSLRWNRFQGLHMVEILNKCPSLKRCSLNCEKLQLIDELVPQFPEEHNCLETLDLSETRLTLRVLSALLLRLKNLNQLICVGTGIVWEDELAYLFLVGANSSLEELDLSRCHEFNFLAVETMFRCCTGLKSLNLEESLSSEYQTMDEQELNARMRDEILVGLCGEDCEARGYAAYGSVRDEEES